MVQLTADERSVLAVYADLAPLGPQGAAMALAHLARTTDKPLPTEDFLTMSLALAERHLLDRSGHLTYPQFRINAAGREALAQRAGSDGVASALSSSTDGR